MTHARVVVLVLLAGPALAAAQEPPSKPATIIVMVPEDARVTFDESRTRSKGPVRRYQSPPLHPDRGYFYRIKASWTARDGAAVVRVRRVRVEAGKESIVDFTEDEPKPLDPDQPEPAPEPDLDAPFVATPPEVVEGMLDLAAVTAADVVYDLGCGDGRIVIAAASRRGSRGVGIDLDPRRVRESRERARQAGVSDRVEIREQNVLETPDLSRASVVMIYLLPDINRKLEPILKRELKPGSRVVSHAFRLGDWPPDQTVELEREGGLPPAVLYLWKIRD